MHRPALTLLLLLFASAASAHVKWFEDYEVAAEPVPVWTTLALPYFWLGVGLVLAFFIATTLLERRPPGLAATRGLDWATRPLREHADAFMIAVLAAFFVALFAVGGTYLTPELKTGAGWVPWAQFVIALLLVPRRTRPLAALAIVLLWALTLRDYDLFHLLDYLALGLGLAGYLLLSGLPDGRWHDRRFAVLRWGIALALMWSSMEKFMYPQWFLPLLEEKPFLAFGIPFGPYTTMAGVAEFTLGFGLLWTPLVRRLSAAALFALMFVAVYPFGRVDLIGHATILASLLVILADPIREEAVDLEVTPRDRRTTLFVPLGIAVALAVTMISYAGMHRSSIMRRAASWPRCFDRNRPGRCTGRRPGRLPEPFGEAPNIITVRRARPIPPVPHHQSAVEMARIYLQSGKDPELRRLSEAIIASQEAEIRLMRGRDPEPAAPHVGH